MSMVVNYAVRKTYDNKFQLCTVSVENTLHGKRRFSDTMDLKYKNETFAIKKAHKFYHNLYHKYTNTTLNFIGVLNKDEYTGELA